ncbi:Uncharacterised protein g10311 [Pycnogonum litorale]
MMSRKHSASYIDGIFVKVSEKYRPPRKVTFPVHFQNRLDPDIFNLDYDFSLENRVVEEAKKRMETEAAIEDAESEIVASQIESFSRTIECNGTSEATTDTPNLELPEPDKETVKLPHANFNSTMNGPAMLTPLPSTTSSSTSVKSSDASSNSTYNPADFEGDTSSPFDNMELKTINDIAELNSVFQTLAPPSNTNTTESQRTDNHGNYANISSSQPPHSSTAFNANNCTSSVYADGSQYVNSATVKSVASTQYFSSPRTEPFVSNANNRNQVTRYSPVMVSYETYSPSTQGTLRTSKSFSDLTNIGKEASGAASKSGNYVHASIATVSPQRPKSVELQNENIDAYSRKPEVINVKDEVFAKLSAEHQLFAKHISDMGFPPARVSRIVKKLGADDKKVIDSLCEIQKFVEQGYVDLDIEDGLEAFGSSDEKLLEFLKALNQLKDLGFDKDSVKKALIANDNDRDKAVDQLVS